jgi:iron complex outermembrane receptor protein
MDLAQFPVGLIGEQAGLPVSVVLVGNPAFDSEVLVAHEIGWRRQFSKAVSLDIAGFLNRYTNLEDVLPMAPKFELAPVPHLVSPGVFSNTQSGRSGGVEASLTWAPMHGVRISPGYTWFDIRLRRLVPESTSPPPPLLYEKTDPRNQFNIRSYVDMPKRFSVDAAVYYVSSVRPYCGVVPTDIAGYYRVDAQVSKRFSNGLEIGIAGENLQGGHHPEFAPEVFGRGALLGRSAYVRVAWRSVL